MDLDIYQMLDMYRDAKAKLKENGFQVPEYAVNSENPHDDNVSNDDMEYEVHKLGEDEFMGLVAMRKPSRVAEYEDNNGGDEGDRKANEVGDNGEDSSEDSDIDESGKDVDEEGDVISLIDVDEMSEQEIDIDLDDLRNPYLEDEIPRLINTGELDDNNNSTDVWTKIDLNGTKLHTLFWTACNAYTKHVHKQAMKAIKKESVATHEWLRRELIEN
ncbi:hypothetical protein Cgig2_000912 [Carnegiea gigantea]|uniref:Uncharacterized protein n=1 Tax=Carnegiea gigantea TaxID=171969 RepID=A0A9Q1QN24_9CARY|nr:hypothetical protein Cgig2_000912 [Carnegiea gigantea]